MEIEYLEAILPLYSCESTRHTFLSVAITAHMLSIYIDSVESQLLREVKNWSTLHTNISANIVTFSIYLHW